MGNSEMLDFLQRFISGVETRNPHAAESLREMTEQLQALLGDGHDSDLADVPTMHDITLLHVSTFDHLI